MLLERQRIRILGKLIRLPGHADVRMGTVPSLVTVAVKQSLLPGYETKTMQFSISLNLAARHMGRRMPPSVIVSARVTRTVPGSITHLPYQVILPCRRRFGVQIDAAIIISPP